MKEKINSKEPIVVSKEVFDAIENIRKSGLTNMMDRHGVMHIANQRDYFAAYVWLAENPELYLAGFFNGFVVETVDKTS